MVLCVFAVRCGQTSGRRHQTSSFCRCGWPCPSFVQHFHSLAHDETIVSSAIALTLFCGCFYDLWHMADVDVLFNIVAMNFLSCARLLALIYMCICMFVFCLGWIMWSCKLHCSRTLPCWAIHYCALNIELILGNVSGAITYTFSWYMALRLADDVYVACIVCSVTVLICG